MKSWLTLFQPKPPPPPKDDEIIATLKIIRDMDQLIFNMSQKTSWPEMRPIFQELLEGTMRRMNKESSRIRDLLIPEIKKVYLDDVQKQIEGKR